MTIKLNRVELSNIRSHTHTIFTPESEGITAISGANGAGKSTIVDSISWILYGTKPTGVPKAASIMRDKAEFGKDKFFAKLLLEVDGLEILVERRIVSKTGGVECEVWEESDSGDYTYNNKTYKQVAGPSVSHSEPYIRKRLKMDEAGFLAAILVQQKQVDQLISSGPRERAQVIEKLTGISSITSALVESRQELNLLKKSATFTDVDEDSLKALKKEQKENSKKLDEISLKFKSLSEELEIVKDKGVSLKERVDEETKKEEDSSSLKSEKAVLEEKIKIRENDFIKLSAEKKEKQKRLSNLSSSISLSEIEPKVNSLKNDLLSVDIKLDRLVTDLEKDSKSFKEYSDLIDSAKVKDLKIAISMLEEKRSELSKVTRFKEKKKQEIIKHQSGIDQIENAISIINSDDRTCPTCLQHVDHPELVIPELNKKKSSLLDEILKEQNVISSADQKIENSQIIIDKFEVLIKALEESERILSEKSIKERDIFILKNEKTAIEQELKGLDKLYSEAKRSEEFKTEYDQILKSVQSLSSEIENDKRRVIEIESLLKEIKIMSTSSFKKLKQELEDLRQKHNILIKEHSDARNDKNLLAQKDEFLIEKIEKSEKEIEKYKNLLKSIEITSHSTNLIEEFREDRIRNSIPVIEVYASDLLNRFTEGKFSRLKLDHKFNATVVLSDGSERPVGLLSGGELSAASMSLRLAISMLLNSGASKNLIILDEVLVSQDEARAEVILSTIKEVCKGQVVLIAHNENMDSIADKVVEL